MLTVTNQSVSPPNPGWRWNDGSNPPIPDICHTNKNVWLGKVHDRLRATGGFMGEGWAEAAEDWFCRNSNVECQDLNKLEPRERTFSDFQQFAHVVGRHVENGGAMVSQEEAERRASICATCPKNRPLAGMCSSCKAAEILSWLYRLARNRSTSKDGSLSSCNVCGCALTLAVWAPLEVQKDDRFGVDEYPNHCWKREMF